MQNAIRTTSQLAEFFPLAGQELNDLESLEEKYKLAIPPYYFSLINLDDPRRPDWSAIAPLHGRNVEHVGRGTRGSAGRRQGLPGPRPDPSLSRPCAARDDARLLHVLPVLHAQAGDHGPRRLGRPQPQRRADDRICPPAPRNPRRDRLGRRPPVAARRPAAVVRHAVWRRSIIWTSFASAPGFRSRFPSGLFDTELVDLLAGARRSGFRRISTTLAKSPPRRPGPAATW